MRKQKEQELVDGYCKFLEQDKSIKILSKNCKSKNHADIEYTKDNCLYRIEAKTHLTEDIYNAIHKVFGELLKMTGYENPENQEIKYQLLFDGRINEGKTAKDFFVEGIKKIPKDRLLKFGKLIPVDKIIVFNCEQVVNKDNPKESTWNEIVE